MKIGLMIKTLFRRRASIERAEERAALGQAERAARAARDVDREGAGIRSRRY
jgi:hypothetical protein